MTPHVHIPSTLHEHTQRTYSTYTHPAPSNQRRPKAYSTCFFFLFFETHSVSWFRQRTTPATVAPGHDDYHQQISVIKIPRRTDERKITCVWRACHTLPCPAQLYVCPDPGVRGFRDRVTVLFFGLPSTDVSISDESNSIQHKPEKVIFDSCDSALSFAVPQLHTLP